MCPRGQDQTERGPQRWHILVPRVKQLQRLPNDRSRRSIYPKELFFNEDKHLDLWPKLARPAVFNRHLQSVGPSRPALLRKRLSSFESAPSELLDMILGQPGLTEGDLIVLALASDVLWSHVLHLVETRVRKAAAPWAGCELACTGTYLTYLPEGFMKDNLAHLSVKGKVDGTPLVPYGNMPLARAINRAAMREYKEIEGDLDIPWRAALDNYADHVVSRIEYTRLPRIRDDILAITTSRWSSAPETTWRLRNLTTKQYIRCLPLKSSTSPCRGYVDHPRTRKHPLRIDDVILMYACWTSCRPWDDPNVTGIYNGIWAGHCFDIVSQEVEESANEKWVDFTDDVVTEAARLRGMMKRPEGYILH